MVLQKNCTHVSCKNFCSLLVCWLKAFFKICIINIVLVVFILFNQFKRNSIRLFPLFFYIEEFVFCHVLFFCFCFVTESVLFVFKKKCAFHFHQFVLLFGLLELWNWNRSVIWFFFFRYTQLHYHHSLIILVMCFMYWWNSSSSII